MNDRSFTGFLKRIGLIVSIGLGVVGVHALTSVALTLTGGADGLYPRYCPSAGVFDHQPCTFGDNWSYTDDIGAVVFSHLLMAMMIIALAIVLYGVMNFFVWILTGRTIGDLKYERELRHTDREESDGACHDRLCPCGYHKSEVFQDGEWLGICKNPDCTCPEAGHKHEAFDTAKNEWVEND